MYVMKTGETMSFFVENFKGKNYRVTVKLQPTPDMPTTLGFVNSWEVYEDGTNKEVKGTLKQEIIEEVERAS